MTNEICNCECHLPENQYMNDYHFDEGCFCRKCYGCGKNITLYKIKEHYKECILFQQWHKKQKRKYLRQLGI